jgi:hypothetical protein
MSLERNVDGVPEVFKKVYAYFSDDLKMWDMVNNLVIIDIKEREYREIAQMVEKKAGKGAIKKKILEMTQKYDGLVEKSPKDRVSNKKEKISKSKKTEEKESINSRQKSFRARKALKNTKRVSFYLSEDRKARMDVMRLERKITQEELLNWMVEHCLNLGVEFER